MVGWLRRLCGGWVRNAGNKAQLRPAGAVALPELGNIEDQGYRYISETSINKTMGDFLHL